MKNKKLYIAFLGLALSTSAVMASSPAQLKQGAIPSIILKADNTSAQTINYELTTTSATVAPIPHMVSSMELNAKNPLTGIQLGGFTLPAGQDTTFTFQLDNCAIKFNAHWNADTSEADTTILSNTCPGNVSFTTVDAPKGPMPPLFGRVEMLKIS